MTPRILIVEDDPVCAELTRSTLVRSGYRAAIAADATQMFVTLNEALPDLILLDLSLPIMDGVQIVRSLKADPAFARIPVVAFSSADDEGAKEALAAGCAGFLSKPVDARTFRSAVGWFFETPTFPFRPLHAASTFRFSPWVAEANPPPL